jgi:hypothetical protein
MAANSDRRAGHTNVVRRRRGQRQVQQAPTMDPYRRPKPGYFCIFCLQSFWSAGQKLQ